MNWGNFDDFSLWRLNTASTDEPIIQGIIATYEGAETSYKLEEMPIVKYKTVGDVKYADLYLKDRIEPVLSVALANNKKLIITYGGYVPTDTDNIEQVEQEEPDVVTITEQNGRKFIKGGKLIIIGKDGKMYNVAGIEIKK